MNVRASAPKKVRLMTPQIEKTCEFCNEKFMAYTNRQRVCSKPECKEWRDLTRKDEGRGKLTASHRPLSRNPRSRKLCLHCGKEFLSARSWQYVCSRLVCQEWRKSQPQRVLKELLRTRDTKPAHRAYIPKVCPHCGDKFDARFKTQYVCSKTECQAWRQKQNNTRQTEERRRKNAAESKFITESVTQVPEEVVSIGSIPSKPMIPATCECCGDSYMAWTRRQRVCDKPECRVWALSAPAKYSNKPRSGPNKGNSRDVSMWEPKISVVAGQGVTKGSAITTES